MRVKTHKKYFFSLLIAVLTVFSPAVALASYQQIPSGQLVLSAGHVDAFNVSGTADSLQMLLKEDITAYNTMRNPEDIVLHVKSQSYSTAPASVPGIGQNGYLLPQNSSSDLLWPGWDTNGTAGFYQQIYLEFLSISGPGSVYLFQNKFGQALALNTNGSFQLQNGSQVLQAMPGHTHANWVFTNPGQYTMFVRAFGVNKAGQTVASAPRTYTWWVGDIPASNPGEVKPSPSPTLSPTPIPAPSNTVSPPTPAPATPTNPVAPNNTVNNEGATTPSQQDAKQGPQSEANFAPNRENKNTSARIVRRNQGSYVLSPNTHSHPNWVFTKPGKYSLHLRLNSQAKDGTKLSAKTTLHFQVGSTPSGTVNAGHFDLGALIEAGTFQSAIRDDRTPGGTWRSPESLIFSLGDAAKQIAPAGLEFVARAGTPIWMIGTTQQNQVPWLGANSQHPSISAGTTGSITFTLLSASGPGDIAVFDGGGLGKSAGTIWFTSTLQADDSPGAPNSSTKKALAQTGSLLPKEWLALSGGIIMIGLAFAAYGRKYAK